MNFYGIADKSFAANTRGFTRMNNLLGSLRKIILPSLTGGRFGVVRRRVAGRRLGLQIFELGKGSGELAVIGGVVAHQEVGGEGDIARATEGRDGADGGRSDQFILQSDVAIESRLLHAPNSQLTPARGGHGFDQRELRGRAGLVLIEI
jgi:hypothetical protein